MRRLLACALVVVTTASAAWAAPPRLLTVRRLWGIGEIRYFDGKEQRLLERFREPHAVHATAIARSGRWAFVWHERRPPRELSIYDLGTARRVAHFEPGAGGDLAWTPGDHLVHDWGCGTNCAAFAVYDVNGRRRLEDVVSGLEISSSKRYLVTFPSLFASNEPVRVYDLAKLRKIFERRIPGRQINSVRWSEAHGRLALDVIDLNGTTVRMDVPLQPRRTTEH